MSDSTKQACPICRSADLSTELQTELFSFGVDEKAVELSAEISVHHCNKCAFSFSDEDASNARHDAACRHLHLLTPTEIRAIRKKRGMSRAEFARATRIGEASLGRWENGLKFQNAACDSLLYLIAMPGNLEALTSREFSAGTSDIESTRAVPSKATTPRYDEPPKLRLYDPGSDEAQEMVGFQLWPTGT